MYMRMTSFASASGCAAADEKIRVTFSDGVARESLWGLSATRRSREVSLIFFDIVHMSRNFAARARRAVRFDESAADEKRLVFVGAQIFDGGVGGVIVGMPFAVAVENDELVGMGGLRSVGGEWWKNAVGLENL